MASKLHYVLFENVTGYSLILVKEFDEIIRKFSAHVNSFLKPVAFVPFDSVAEALENVQYICESRVSPLLSRFLRQNLPVKDAILGVADQKLGENILELGVGFECIWDSSIRELIRIVRANSSKLLRTLVIQPGAITPLKNSKTSAQETVPGKKAERRARLIVALSRARIQLDLVGHLADTGLVKTLEFLDNMDSNLAKSVKRLRTSYGVHFPELCHNGGLSGLDDFAFASIVTYAPLREDLVKDRDKLVEWLDGNHALADSIISLARSSTGQDLSCDDVKVLQQYGEFLLKLLKSRNECCQLLESRVRSFVPNLAALMDHILPGRDSGECLERIRTVGNRVSPAIVAARLISHAVTLDRLARMTSSRVDSLGASRALFRRSGAAAAAASGLLQCTISHHSSQSQSGGSSTEPEKNAAVSTLMKNLIEMSGGRLYPIVVRRKAARLLAAKSALAVRADCYRRMDPLASEKLEVPEKLESGDYGKSLGQEIKRQLRVWAETNGVHLECTAEELEKQRVKRKKYRKAKRKRWLKRKLTGVSNSTKSTTSSAVESGVVEYGISSSDDASDEEVKQASPKRPGVETLTLSSNLRRSKVMEPSNDEEVTDRSKSATDQTLSGMLSKPHENDSGRSSEKLNSTNECVKTQIDVKVGKRRASGERASAKPSKRMKVGVPPERRVLRSATRAKMLVRQ